MIEQFFNLFKEKTGAETYSAWAFDLDVVELVSATVITDSSANEIKQKLEARLPLGMTQIDKVLKHAKQSTEEHIVLITDAIATLGSKGAALQQEAASTIAALRAPPRPDNAKLWVLNLGTKIDNDVAVAISGLGGGRVVTASVTSNASVAALRMSKAWDELLAPVGMNASVAPGPGVHVHPKNFYDLRAGSEVVYMSWGASDPDYE